MDGLQQTLVTRIKHLQSDGLDLHALRSPSRPLPHHLPRKPMTVSTATSRYALVGATDLSKSCAFEYKSLAAMCSAMAPDALPSLS
jgi:hypothetical protein